MEYIVALMLNILALFFGIFSIIKLRKRGNSFLGIIKKVGLLPFNLIDFLKGLLISVVTITLVFLFFYLNNNIVVKEIVWNFKVFFEITIKLLLLAIIEEIFFRSFLITGLKTVKVKNKFIYVIAAIIFGVVHISNPHYTVISFISASLGGVMYTYAFIYAGNIWAPLGIHFGWNYIQSYLYGFTTSGIEFNSILKIEISGNDLITGGEYGPEGSILIIPIRILVIVMIWYFYKYRHTDY